MKLTTVMYERKITKEEKSSLGAYSNETLKIEGVISEGDNVDLAILSLMERVHAHLDVPFNSTVKAKVSGLVKENVEKVLPKSDTIPSDPQLDRPVKVDEAKEEMDKLQKRKEDESTGDKPKKAKRATRKKKEPEVKKPVQEEEVKEEVKEEKPKGVVYDNTLGEHKVEFAGMLDNMHPTWRDTPANRKVAKALSESLVGKVLYLGSGNISAQFSKAIESAKF